MRYSASNLSSQKGAVLLLFALLLLIGSTYSLVSKLNSDTNFYVRQSKETQESLRLAKQALIAYALSFPEIDALSGTDKINGPGYLPCPDINNNGSAGGTCSSGGNTTIGRFPNNTLETADLRDSSGSRLWYALSDNFRNSAGLEPLNSETPGQLTVDGNNDIVAVVIAPGAPVGNQNRNPADTNILTEIANYLETENNDLDLSFISVDPSSIDFTDFNDRLVSITRQELMEQIEKRVLGEAKIFLETYKTTYGAYPWLSSFADPKTNEKRPTGSHSGSDDQANLTDSSANFTLWGVANGDVVWNITDGSYGVITAFTSTTLTVGAGLTLGSENDFDTNDEYYIDINSPTYSTSFTGTAVATGGSGGFILEDTTKNFVALGVQIGDIVELVADGSSGVIETVTSTQLTVGTLIGTTTAFSNGNVYRIRSSIGRATADSDGNGLTLDDTNVDFTVMGIQAGELIRNTTDGSYGRISVVSANRLTVDDLLFGVDNTFSNNDYYSLPRLNGVTNIREGLIGIHEAGEAFKTRINFDWAITANALDVTVLNSGILQNTMQTYAASGSEVFDDSVGTCIWRISNFADCFVSFKDFVNISGNLTSGSDTDVITDSGALFNTNAVKRGDIAQNYDDETLVVSGTVDAGNSGTTTGAPTTLTLQDTNNDFINVNIAVGDTVFNTTDGSSGIIDSVAATQITVASLSGGADNIFETGDGYQIGTEPTLYDASANFSSYERYNYLVQNQTLESELGVGKIQAILADKEGVDTLIAESYVGESSTPMEFRPGDSYRIYQPRQFVIQSVASETQLTTDNYTSGTNPDFDNGEYYRVMPAANSQNATLDWQTTSGGQDILIDISADFVNDGVEVGDIVENHAGAFGEITSLSGQVIWTVLYGGSSQSFSSGNQYTVYYDYVYSRRHTIHAKFQGTQATKTVTEERVRDVCLGYNADCTAVSSAVNFTGNTGVPLFSIQDYQEDETTEVGSATFTPSALSSGSLLVSNINFGLSEANGDFPAWFTNNDWHKLMYIAYSAGDAPGAAAACIAGADCITLNELDINDATVFTNNANNAVVIAAGREINTIQDSNCNGVASTAQNRSSGTINEYYELENCSAGDDSFREQYETNTFNDQVRIVEP